ncbi:MAG TPA: baseplate J protein [Alcanivorax sp.]|jgi:uncharacterized phage protein gp47/JayE|nr:baseplate J protein [Alcanivorax sp.]HAV68726.1 baseplate J protein [Alcanivorax sp.]|tara:strand:- start:47880 stop:48944 length:1065 start_codon:yes stop_codon:yes gene_type:complete
MPFERPHIAQIKARIEADVQGRLVAGDPRLRRDLVRILGQMETGVAHGLHGRLAWLAENLLPNTSDPDMLAAWATIYGVPRLGATTARGPVMIYGMDELTLPSGKLMQDSDGIQYQLDAGVTLSQFVATGDVTAVEPGAAGNADSGQTLTLLDPEPGVNSQIVVKAPGLTGGAEFESVEAWRARLLQRIQRPPQGGSIADYESWARAAHPSITDVWPRDATPSAGYVTIYCMAYGSTETGAPDPTVIQAVEDYIQQERPVQARFYVLAPLLKSIDMTIAVNPDTEAVRTAVQESLKDLFQREAAPGETIPLSHVTEAISLATGEYDHTINLQQSDLATTSGEILVLGDITWLAL